MRRTLCVALVAVLVLLAGCSAGTGGDAAATDTPTPDGTDTPTTSGDATGGDTTTAADGSSSGGDSDGEVDFYLSDRPSVIDDFDHLNVTVTKVGVHRAGGESGSESGEWLEFDVNATADLTRLQGANATKIGTFDLPNGSYTKVFVYVSDTRGEINGTDKRVKLPSDKLQLNKGFTVGDGESPSFVFDIAVHEAGKSGKYILSPVVSESGTGDEVEIRDVDDARGEESGENDDAADGEATDAPAPTTETATPTTTTAEPTTDATPE